MEAKKTDLTRRKFIASSLGCLATAGLAGAPAGLTLAQDNDQSGTTVEKEIIYRTLGKTGLKMPVVSMGVGPCNDPRVVQACYEIGMRHFETAAGYAFGRNEQILAGGLHKLGVRDKVFITTKTLDAGQRRGLTTGEQYSKRLIETFEGSLRRLRTDYVDILLIHGVGDADTVANEAIINTLLELKKAGKTRSIGISTHGNMAAVINEAVRVGSYDVIQTSFNFTLADDTELLTAIENAASKGIGIIAMKTQAGGANFPNPDTLRQYDSVTVNSAALKWVLRNESVTTSVPAIPDYEIMRAAFAMARDLEYTEAEKNFLSDNSIKLSMGFCRQCRGCLATCPHNADVPTLMRTHMYATQYGSLQFARSALDEIETGRGLQVCTNCTECSARCSNSVDIPRKIEDLKLIYS
ncbi:MAG: aldo/keto reductase [Candidatus Zixiibacteriota bacterium]|nr:MAG: aldo/keto reductase [candidate division Zixibacteria bacterium]